MLLNKNWKIYSIYIICIECLVAFTYFMNANATAAELQLRPISTAGFYEFSLEVHKAEKLAGMKITNLYPEKFLHFKTAEKMSAFKEFTHIINDNDPGKLTIVMASAKGVSGENLRILKLNFIPSLEKHHFSIEIESNSCQLMNENLQEIACEISTNIKQDVL